MAARFTLRLAACLAAGLADTCDGDGPGIRVLGQGRLDTGEFDAADLDAAVLDAGAECGDPAWRTLCQGAGRRWPGQAHVGALQRKLPRVDVAAEQRAERHAEAQGLGAEADAVAGILHGDVGCGEDGLRQQLQGHGAADADGPAEALGGEGGDGVAVAAPVHHAGNQPGCGGEQGQNRTHGDHYGLRAAHLTGFGSQFVQDHRAALCSKYAGL